MQIINFYHVNDQFGCFSNFSPHAIILDLKRWSTVEHYFQAQKFVDHGDQKVIRLAATAFEAAQKGRDPKMPLRPDWEQIKVNVMLKAVRAKVIQHSDVRAKLLSTGVDMIREHTSNDRYWADGGDGTGQNKLGIILMEIRDALKRKNPYTQFDEALQPPWFYEPKIDPADMFWRMGRGETYLDEWFKWYHRLSSNAKGDYQARYPEVEDWVNFYSKN